MVQILKASQINKPSVDIDLKLPNFLLLNNINNKLMAATKEKKALGVAAPQVGLFFNVFSIGERLYINPSYEPTLPPEEEISYEGCLSVPGVNIPVVRYKSIKVKYIFWNKEDNSFTPKEELLTEMEAKCFQHEYSHLQAKSIIDEGNLNRTDRRNLKKKF